MGILGLCRMKKWVVFFVALHDAVDILLSKYQLTVEKSKVITNCLKHVSVDKHLREKWCLLVNPYGFPKPVEVFVLEKICTMFVKSKQQIVREKFDLKPQKGSVALREELKGKIGKGKIGKGNSARGKQTASSTSSVVPEVVLKLRNNLESPEHVTSYMREIFQQRDKRDILLSLSGKELTKLLLASGKPGLDGKKKSRQVDVLLDQEYIIKCPGLIR
ncbi:hypothetical protein OS493_019497 [Desmophyllum pertusum]|uniref:Uncharacterized protein n=1 Tax=Desmophyllum pertusum TaxID=174260 RepID=A0A9W9ZNZ3_9CNID|nr:hypothetical protein OS493_019497 [Desmophyllum pertusum]